MAGNTEKFAFCNEWIRRFEQVCKQADVHEGAQYRCGVDLGTSCIVVAVIDEDDHPVAGRVQLAEAVRDGMVVDYWGAVQIVRKMKEELEGELGPLLYAAAAIPPGTMALDGGAVRNVVESAGFELTALLEESSAANALLQIENGAIVDIGGGTTGISVFEAGKEVYAADEATGGKHFTLTLAGALGIPLEDAERYKRDPARHREILPILRPVAEKVASIIQRHVAGKGVEELYLVGGSSCLTGIEEIIAARTGLPAYKPQNPLFVTPLGIALNCGPKNGGGYYGDLHHQIPLGGNH